MPEIRKYKKRFNSEINCASLWGVNLLIGTNNGLLLLDRSGQVIFSILFSIFLTFDIFSFWIVFIFDLFLFSIFLTFDLFRFLTFDLFDFRAFWFSIFLTFDVFDFRFFLFFYNWIISILLIFYIFDFRYFWFSIFFEFRYFIYSKKTQIYIFIF